MKAPAPKPYGLKQIGGGGGGKHVVVILHGIRQVRDDLAAPFGQALVNVATGATLYVYGYNHTQGLVTNGELLATILEKELKADRIDLVGYSMGGLVARLAASDIRSNSIRTVVTLATPNRGALSNAQLETLGQLGREAFEWLSPLAPRSEGVIDLTRAAEIMNKRYNSLLAEKRTLKVRYASVPALFYNPQRANTDLGPSVAMSGLYAFFTLANVKRKIFAMSRPHDGIVTEDSCDLTRDASYDWSEVHLAATDDNTPARAHVVIDKCADQDHQSILSEADVARLTWAILSCADWQLLKNHDAVLQHRLRVTTPA
jgi:pimeloyl-ACP methyl ester carboxylesterase